MSRASLMVFSLVVACRLATADDDLLELTMQKQEEYMRSIRSSSYVSNRQIETHAGMRDKGRIDEKREELLTRTISGDLSLTSITGHRRILSGEGNGALESYSRHGVIATEYLGTWYDGDVTTALTLADHKNPKEMPQQSVSRNSVLLSNVDILEFAYGLGHLVVGAKSLREVVAASTDDVYLWTAEHASDTDPTTIVLSLVARNNPKEIAARASMDTARGCIFTSFQASSKLEDGSPNRTDTWSIEPKEVVPGFWLPESLHGFVAIRSGSYEERVDIDEQLSDIQVNQAISDDLFSWKSLGYTGDTGFRMYLDGSVGSFDIRDGELTEVSRSEPENPHKSSTARLLHEISNDIAATSESPNTNAVSGKEFDAEAKNHAGAEVPEVPRESLEFRYGAAIAVVAGVVVSLILFAVKSR